MNCTTYSVTNLLYFGISRPGTNEILNQQTCTNYSNSYDLTLDECPAIKAQLTQQIITNCVNQAYCNIGFNYTNFTSNCTPSDPTSKFYVSYVCYQRLINLPYNNKVDRTVFAFGVVFIDIASMLVLIITIVV